MWKKDLPIFLRPCRTSQPSWRTAAGAGPGPAEAPLGSSPLRDIPAAAGGRGSSMLLAASRLDADELSMLVGTPSIWGRWRGDRGGEGSKGGGGSGYKGGRAGDAQWLYLTLIKLLKIESIVFGMLLESTIYLIIELDFDKLQLLVTEVRQGFKVSNGGGSKSQA